MSEQLMFQQGPDIFSDLKPRIVEEFFIFHRENPHVFDLVRRFAWEARRSGRQHFGINAIMERIRWYTNVETTDATFKINAHHAPCYARLLIQEDPSFATIFQRRHTPGTLEVA